MTSNQFISTYEYFGDFDNIKYGVMENNFLMINLNYLKDELDIDISSLLKKHKKLWLYGKLQHNNFIIPEYITHLCFKNYNQLNDTDILNKLPETLEFLSIMDDSFNGALNNLPPNLKHLEIHSYYSFRQSLEYLPIGLEILVLNSCDGSIIKNSVLPPKLKKLVIKNRKLNKSYVPWHFSCKGDWSHENIPLLKNLPASLEYLYINDVKNAQKSVKEYLPNVKIIYINN